MTRWKMHFKEPGHVPYWESPSDRKTQWDAPIFESTVFFSQAGTIIPLSSAPPTTIAAALVELETGGGGEGSRGERGDLMDVLRRLGPHFAASRWDATRGGVVIGVGGVRSAEVVMREHGIRDGVERVDFGPISLFHVQPLVDTSRVHVVSTVVFAFSSSYRDAGAYAGGLLHLSAAVLSHLPTCYLRVYFDASVRHSGSAMWDHVFSELSGKPHVQLVQFVSPAFSTTPPTIGHVDLFGTFARMLPLFASDSAEEAWALGPPDGRVVYCADADFSDGIVEHAVLHAMQWFVGMAEEDGKGGGGRGEVGEEEEEEEGEEVELLSVVGGGSTALRHQPYHGMPTMMAGQVATRFRFDAGLLRGFLEDAAGGGVEKSGAGGWYARLLQAEGAKVDSSYKWRKVALQKSPFPFGADESFLVSSLTSWAIARPHKRTWIFLTVPFPSRPLTKCLDKAREAEERREGVEAATKIVEAASRAVGEKEGPWTSFRGERPRGKAFVAHMCRLASYYPRLLSEMLPGADEKGRFVGPGLGIACAPQASAVSEGIIETLSATVQGIAAGSIPTKGNELEFFLQNLRVLAHGQKAGLLRAAAFSVGQAAIQTNPSHFALPLLLTPLSKPIHCPVPDPTLPFSRLPPPKPRSKRDRTIYEATPSDAHIQHPPSKRTLY